MLAGKRARRRVVTRASRRKAKTTPARARAKEEEIADRNSCFVWSHHGARSNCQRWPTIAGATLKAGQSRFADEGVIKRPPSCEPGCGTLMIVKGTVLRHAPAGLRSFPEDPDFVHLAPGCSSLVAGSLPINSPSRAPSALSLRPRPGKVGLGALPPSARTGSRVNAWLELSWSSPRNCAGRALCRLLGQHGSKINRIKLLCSDGVQDNGRK